MEQQASNSNSTQVEWLALTEATARLERSPKTLERLVAAGEVKSRTEPRPGRKPERVYHAGDIERIRFDEERGNRTRAVVPARPVSTELMVGGDSAAVLRELFERLGADRKADREAEDARQDRQLYRDQLRSKLWLTWHEASDHSGIPVAALRKLAQDEQRIVARQFGRRSLVLRSSLEDYQG